MVEMRWYLTNLTSMEVYSASIVKILKDASVMNMFGSYVDESIIFPKPIFTPPLPDPPTQEPPRPSEAVKPQASNALAAEPIVSVTPIFFVIRGKGTE